jgi:hypothetical protein
MKYNIFIYLFIGMHFYKNEEQKNTKQSNSIVEYKIKKDKAT